MPSSESKWPYDVTRWLMVVKQRLESLPTVIGVGDITGGAALTKVNDTNVTLTLTGNPTTALLAPVTMTLGWTGTLAVGRGGTNIASYDVGDLLYGSASNVLSLRTIGSPADVLTVAGGVPTWAPPAAAATSVIVDDTATNATMYPTWVTSSSGSLPLKVSSTKLSFNPSSGTLATTSATASSSVTIGAGTGSFISNVNALTVISGSNTPTFFSMDQSATDLTLGFIWIESNNPHTGNNTFSTIGFTGHRVSPSNDAILYATIAGVFADQTAQTGDLAFVLRYLGNHTERVRFKGNGTVGIGTSSPAGLLHLLGTRSLSAWGTTGAVLRVQSGTVTDTSSSGTVANAEINTFSQPTIAASSATTFTNASTLFLSAAPAAGTNVTITTAWALKVAAGAAGLDGGVSVNAGALGTARSFAVDRIAGNSTRSLEYNFVFGTNSGFQLTADITSQRNWMLNGSTFTGDTGTRTITNYATLYVAGAGTAGANAAITNNYALWIDDGTARFDGNVGIGTTSPLSRLHLAAGSATANTAPLQFTSGTVETTPRAGVLEFTTDDYFATITTGAARKAFVLDDGARLTSGKIPVASTNGRLIDGPTLGAAGLKIPAIQAVGRSDAQTAAVASVVTYTFGAADSSVLVTTNVNVTTSTLHSFAVQVDYTDETNTARTVTLTLSQLNSTFVAAITNGTGAGPYEGVPLHLRCKASSAITVKTTGTFTSVTYNVEAAIVQFA